MARPNDNGVKKILFLAPGAGYAGTVMTNLFDTFTRKGIGWRKTEGRETTIIYTDKVLLQITHIDPVRWNDHMFKDVDAVFGKKELVEKARERFFHLLVNTPTKSLQKYILEAHSTENNGEVKPRTTYIPEITKVHFNPPMTIVLWDDGTKTTVKCQEGDVYSQETGLALCIAKKSLGNMPNFNNVFKKWIPEEESVYPSTSIIPSWQMTEEFAKVIEESVDKMLKRHNSRGVNCV